MPLSLASKVVRFGLFELDVKAIQLRRNGIKVRLAQQPLQVLDVLLERPGEVVSREELRQRLWPSNVFVDFDHGLNKSIQKLREALGDSSDSPRFIETVPRSGYRFIAPVIEVGGQAWDHTHAVPPPKPVRPEVVEDRSEGAGREVRQATESGNEVSAATSISATEHAATTAEESRRRGRWLTLAVAGVIAVVLAAFWYLHRPLRTPRVSAYTKITHDGLQKVLTGTDGARIYFNDATPDPISEVAVTGGEIEHIPVRGRDIDWLEDVSPDGSNFLISSGAIQILPNRPHWNLRMPGGSVHSLPDAIWGAFSPDGNMVAYSTAVDYLTSKAELWLARSDGARARKLASVQNAAAHNVTWSPDGSVLRFFRDDGLWEISSNGTNLHQVLPAWHAPSRLCCGRWTPDGRLFVFLNLPMGFSAGAEIWALDERRRLFSRSPSVPFQLTTGPIDWGSPAGPLF